MTSVDIVNNREADASVSASITLVLAHPASIDALIALQQALKQAEPACTPLEASFMISQPMYLELMRGKAREQLVEALIPNLVLPPTREDINSETCAENSLHCATLHILIYLISLPKNEGNQGNNKDTNTDPDGEMAKKKTETKIFCWKRVLLALIHLLERSEDRELMIMLILAIQQWQVDMEVFNTCAEATSTAIIKACERIRKQLGNQKTSNELEGLSAKNVIKKVALGTIRRIAELPCAKPTLFTWLVFVLQEWRTDESNEIMELFEKDAVNEACIDDDAKKNAANEAIKWLNENGIEDFAGEWRAVVRDALKTDHDWNPIRLKRLCVAIRFVFLTIGCFLVGGNKGKLPCNISIFNRFLSEVISLIISSANVKLPLRAKIKQIAFLTIWPAVVSAFQASYAGAIKERCCKLILQPIIKLMKQSNDDLFTSAKKAASDCLLQYGRLILTASDTEQKRRTVRRFLNAINTLFVDGDNISCESRTHIDFMEVVKLLRQNDIVASPAQAFVKKDHFISSLLGQQIQQQPHSEINLNHSSINAEAQSACADRKKRNATHFEGASYNSNGKENSIENLPSKQARTKSIASTSPLANCRSQSLFETACHEANNASHRLASISSQRSVSITANMHHSDCISTKSAQNPRMQALLRKNDRNMACKKLVTVPIMEDLSKHNFDLDAVPMNLPDLNLKIAESRIDNDFCRAESQSKVFQVDHQQPLSSSCLASFCQSNTPPADGIKSMSGVLEKAMHVPIDTAQTILTSKTDSNVSVVICKGTHVTRTGARLLVSTANSTNLSVAKLPQSKPSPNCLSGNASPIRLIDADNSENHKVHMLHSFHQTNQSASKLAQQTPSGKPVTTATFTASANATSLFPTTSCDKCKSEVVHIENYRVLQHLLVSFDETALNVNQARELQATIQSTFYRLQNHIDYSERNQPQSNMAKPVSQITPQLPQIYANDN